MDETVYLGCRVSPDFRRRFRIVAAARDMTISDMLRSAAEKETLLTCPFCNGAVEVRGGGLYCPACGETVDNPLGEKVG